MSKVMIVPAGEGRFPLSQTGRLLPTGLVWVDYGIVDGKPFTGTITQETAKESGITITSVSQNNYILETSWPPYL